MYCVGSGLGGQLDKEQNPDSSNVTCNINGESRSTTDEKTRIKKEGKKKEKL
jgi:hypothetical protein